VSVIKPFQALRPGTGFAERVSCAPYDVVSVAEARAAAQANEFSFLRITKPEIESPRAEETLTLAERNLQHFIEDGTLIQEAEPSLYIYRLSTTSNGSQHTQTGVVACCSLEEYEQGLIKKHEQTREDKVADRTDHMLKLRAQTGLIFLSYRGSQNINDLVKSAQQTEPLYDFVCENAVRNTIWKVADAESLVAAFGAVPALYIADGHHRIASAARVRDEFRKRNPHHTGDEPYDYFIAAMFPADELQILAYNRVVKDLNNLSEADFLARVAETFEVAENAPALPEQRGEFSMYLSGEWYYLRLRKGIEANGSIARTLDANILHEFLIEPILGITNLQTDKRIKFIGGRKSIEELQRRVDNGKAKVAFSLYPPSVEDMLRVSDAGEVMPPKSTWFDPKLRDGLLIHLI
jgi:uncharacterized protein (DUF1015 family)